MSTKRGLARGTRQLALLRLEIALAEARLSTLRAAIAEAHSDAGLVALDLAVKAAQTDALTGLRNRNVLWDRLPHDMDLAGRLGQHVGVLLLDLDDFKSLNDRHGHAFGDQVLQWVARALTTTVRASDTVCRLGGDEFVVMASTLTREDVEALVRKVSTALHKPFQVASETIRISASVGFAVFPEDGDSAVGLLRVADESMYGIKRTRSPSSLPDLRRRAAEPPG